MRLLEASLQAHRARETLRSIELARAAIEVDPEYAEALEHLATLLITRRQRYAEGLALIDRAIAARDRDAGLWYSLGWLYEFAAHEIARRGGGDDAALQPRALYERAAAAFRRCLSMQPDGKLQGDAEDLLDHVDNELANL